MVYEWVHNLLVMPVGVITTDNSHSVGWFVKQMIILQLPESSATVKQFSCLS